MERTWKMKNVLQITWGWKEIDISEEWYFVLSLGAGNSIVKVEGSKQSIALEEYIPKQSTARQSTARQSKESDSHDSGLRLYNDSCNGSSHHIISISISTPHHPPSLQILTYLSIHSFTHSLTHSFPPPRSLFPPFPTPTRS